MLYGNIPNQPLQPLTPNQPQGMGGTTLVGPQGNQGMNHFGIERPNRMQTINPQSGKLNDRYTLDPMGAYQESPWAKMMQSNMQGQFDSQVGDITTQANQGIRSGWDALARQGGLTGGGRLALQKSGMRDAMLNKQRASSDLANRMSGLGATDYDRQLRMQEGNINRNLDQIDRSFGANMDVYTEQMQKAASDYMADSMQGRLDGTGGSEESGPWGFVNQVQDWQRKIPGQKQFQSFGQKMNDAVPGAGYVLDPIGTTKDLASKWGFK